MNIFLFINILKKYIIKIISNVKMKFFLVAIYHKSVTNLSQNSDGIQDPLQICDGILIPSQFCDRFVTDSY